MVTIDEARAKVETATAASAEAQATFEEHVRRNRMSEALDAAKAIEAANKVLTAAQSAVDALEFESKAVERDAAIDTLKSALAGILGAETFTNAVALGVTGVSISLDENGAYAIAIRTMGVKVAKAAGSGGSGGSKGRLVFVVEGTEYTSRELLTTFGAAQMGQEWLDAVWERQAKGGGFDQPVKILAKKLNAQLMKKVEGQLVATE